MNTKSPECWASDPRARALRIEISEECSLLLPFDQFAFSQLDSDGKHQKLRLIFAAHEVLVRGTCLRRIETAMQRQELSLLSRMPENDRPLISEGQPIIRELTVRALEPRLATPLPPTN